jgi:uncharacterized protein (TIGR02145 family)
MKKILFSAMILSLAFAACKEKDNNDEAISVTLSLTSASLDAGDTLLLTATVLPENAANKTVIWSSSNASVATVSNGLVTAVDSGSAMIVATTQDQNKSAVCTITVTAATFLGKVSFATDSVWVVGSQTWSDAVTATKCQKTTFYGQDTITEIFLSDCRSNPDYKGDLFSWEAVNQYQNVLCPNGWRVPTKEDFVDLNIALGGTGENEQHNLTLANKYINTWAGAWGGLCDQIGQIGQIVGFQGTHALYWSQSEYTVNYMYILYVDLYGNIDPQTYGYISGFGLSLRCVK